MRSTRRSLSSWSTVMLLFATILIGFALYVGVRTAKDFKDDYKQFEARPIDISGSSYVEPSVHNLINRFAAGAFTLLLPGVILLVGGFAIRAVLIEPADNEDAEDDREPDPPPA